MLFSGSRRTAGAVAFMFCLAPQLALGETGCVKMAASEFAGETVLKVRGEGLGKGDAFGVFKATLHVNTDGAPTSYSPTDELGRTDAINRIDNGVSIYIRESQKKISGDEYFAVYKQWRDAAFPKRLNDKYQINWESVLAADPDGNPCIFKSGDYPGYFGSLTALKNELKGDARGECLVNDQLDQRYIPAIVLRGTANPLKDYGAKVGDLVVAINPKSGTIVPAIIGDSGDGKQIGEGSVALNMALLGEKVMPTTYAGAKKLDTGGDQMIVAVLPGTKEYQPERPYTLDNIAARVASWLVGHGYGSLSDFSKTHRICAQEL